jgi:hypothetical protein
MRNGFNPLIRDLGRVDRLKIEARKSRDNVNLY